MAESILQLYLNAQHIKTSEQENITNLKKVVAEVKKKLEKKRALIISYTLVALDPNINSNDPVIQDVEKVIINKWPAFKNSVTATKDKSTTYVRAVILESLSQMAGKDDLIAAIVWHTARDIVSYYSIGGEKDIIESLLQELANQVEETAQNSWNLFSEIDIPSFSAPEITIDSKITSKDFLIKRLHAAAGPSSVKDGSNSANEEANRYWPNQNQNWAGDFGDIAGEAISSSINTVLRSQNKALSEVGNQINNAVQGFDPIFKQIGLEFLKSAKMANKRSQLLWWKQTLCSPKLAQSYRGYSLLETLILMAIDLADQVDPIYPISVDYLLRETLKDVHVKEVDVSRSLSEWIDQSIKLSEPFKELLKPLSNEKVGRKSLLTELSNVTSTGETDNFFQETGIDDKASVSASSLAVWIFHELQANKMAASK